MRHRGDERAGSWEYIVDVGLHAAQRCPACKKRFWVERRPAKACPKCGGELTETEERRRETKSGFGTQKECEAAMNKLLVKVEEQVYVPPTKASVREYLTKEWLPAVKATIRPTTYRSYEQHVMCHIAPHIGSVKLAKLTGSQVNHLYAKLAETGKKDGKTGLSALTIHHVHTCLHKACKDAVRWGRLPKNPVDAADPPSTRGAAKKEMKTWNAKQLSGFLEATKQDRLAPLWRVLAMTGMRRGEVCGLRWEDVDLEKRRLSVRRALIPHGDGVIVSEPKTAKGGGRSPSTLSPSRRSRRRPSSAARRPRQRRGRLDRDRLRVHDGRRPADAPAKRLTGVRPRHRCGQAAEDPPPRPAAHAR